MKLLTTTDEIQVEAPELMGKMKYLEVPFVFMLEGEAVAYGELELSNNDAYVKMVECMKKGKGHGQAFVSYLKNLDTVKEIWGESVKQSVGFWAKMGAEFNQTVYKEYTEALENNVELKEDFLMPFTIYC